MQEEFNGVADAAEIEQNNDLPHLISFTTWTGSDKERRTYVEYDFFAQTVMTEKSVLTEGGYAISATHLVSMMDPTVDPYLIRAMQEVLAAVHGEKAEPLPRLLLEKLDPDHKGNHVNLPKQAATATKRNPVGFKQGGG
jgi:hypothetical protein